MCNAALDLIVLFRLTTSGDADGLGEIRKKELVKSAMLLGLRDQSDVDIIEHPYV